MLGLGFPQLVLILAGICFTVAGIYGLAPAMVTARFGAGTSAPQPAVSKKQAKQSREASKPVESKPQASSKKEASMTLEVKPAVPVLAAQVKAAAPVAAAVAPPAEATMPDTVVMDQELVEELFAEMFALRATVAGLVGEVHELRSEQRPRRFVIEEVSA